MVRRRKTWKSDPKANDHSALLSVGLGRHITVKSTRGEKAIKGLIGSFQRGRDDELYRHVSDPFEISLVSGIRQEGALPPTKATTVINTVLSRYLDEIADKFSGEMGKDGVDIPTIIRGINWWIKDLACPLFNGIDTLRCSEMANQRYFRSSCVEMSEENLNKGLDMIVQDERLRSSRYDYVWASKQIYHAVMNRILNGIKTQGSLFIEPIPNVVGSGYSFDDKKWELINGVIDEHITKFNSLTAGTGTGEDVMKEVIAFCISLLHILGELPELPQGDGDTDIDGDIEVEIDKDDKDAKDNPNKDGKGYDSWQRHYNVDIDGKTFDEYLQSEWDKLLNTENEEKSASVGGGYSAKLKDDERRTQVYEIPNDNYTGDMEEHAVYVQEYTCDPVELNAHTVNLLNDVERNGFSRKARYGVPTHEIWKMRRFGDTKVFGRKPKRQGELIVLVDCSGSMGYPETQDSNSYNAFQVASAISEVFPMSQTYAFNSDYKKCYAYLVPNGMMIGNSARHQGFSLGGNSDCSALLFMEQLMTGKTESSLAVIISDGSPNPPSPMNSQHLHHHTKSVSHRLYEQGLRFVSVLVGGYTNQEYYPSDVAVQLNTVQDMHLVGDAIARIGQTF